MNIQDIQHVLNNAALHQRNERPNHADLCNQAAVAVGEIGKQRDALLAACQELLKMVDELLPLAPQGCGWGTLATDDARAAIAQATGNKIPTPAVSENLNQPLAQ